MSTGVISVVKAGHTMPKEYQEKVLKECPISFTIAKVEDGKINILPVLASEYQLAESLDKMLNDDKDKNLVIFHARIDQLEDEKQPFIALEGTADGPIMLVFAEGACDKYATDEAVLGPEAEMVTEWLANKISALYVESGRDLKKTMIKLETSAFKDELKEHLEPRGAVVFLTNQDTIHYQSLSNASYGEFPWGSVSNILGYSEKPSNSPPTGGGKLQITITELEALPYKARRAKLKELGFDTLEAAATALNAPAQANLPKSDVSSEETKDRPDIITDKGTISFRKNNAEIHPPASYAGRGLLKWYSKHLDTKGERNDEKAVRTQLGAAYESRPPIPIEKLSGSSHFLRVVNGVDQATAPQSTRKDTETHHIPSPVGKPGMVEDLLAMSPDEVSRAVALRAKQKESGPITEEQIMAPTKPFTSYTERLGNDLTLEEVSVWQDAAFKAIASDKGSAYALLNEYRHRFLKEHPKIMKDLSAAASKAASGTPVDINTLPYKQRRALMAERNKSAAG